VPDVPRELDAIVRRALEPTPDARFATAAELADALEALLRLARPVPDASAVAVALAELFGEQIPRVARALRALLAGADLDDATAALLGGRRVEDDELADLRAEAPLVPRRPDAASARDVVVDDEEGTLPADPIAPRAPAVVVIDDDPATVLGTPGGPPPYRPSATRQGPTAWDRAIRAEHPPEPARWTHTHVAALDAAALDAWLAPSARDDTLPLPVRAAPHARDGRAPEAATDTRAPVPSTPPSSASPPRRPGAPGAPRAPARPTPRTSAAPATRAGPTPRRRPPPRG
jgi:hypothetical protein